MSHPASGWAEQEPEGWERAWRRPCGRVRTRGGRRTRRTSRCSGWPARSTVSSAIDDAPASAAPGDHLARSPGHATVARSLATPSARRSCVEPHRAEPGRVPHRAEGDVAARRGARPTSARPGGWRRSGAHLNGWLTGEVVQDHAQRVLDAALRRAPARMVRRAGRRTPVWTASAFPRSGRPHEVIGSLRPEAAEALGLSPGCQVVVGTGDDHGAALGAGAVGPGVVVDVTGTAEPVGVPSAEAVLDDERLVETHAHAVDGMLLVENPGFVSGGSTQWWAAIQGIAAGRAVRAGRAGARPAATASLFLPDAVRLDGAALERSDARLLRGAGAQPRSCAPRARGARGLRLRAARHRRSLRRRSGSAVRRSGWSAAARARRCGCRSRPTSPAGRCARCTVTAQRACGAAMLAAVAAGHFADLEEAAARVGSPGRGADPAAAGDRRDLRRGLPGLPARCSTASREHFRERRPPAVRAGGRARPRRAARSACAAPTRPAELRPLGLGGVLLGRGCP